MKYDLRLACDTLYFGLAVDDLTFSWLLKDIKNYLFFPLTFNYSHSRSKYYQCEAFNEDCGFYLFFSPHKNLLNDYATIQVTGKFFVDCEREQKLKELVDAFSEFVHYQRIDVCLDVLWEELPSIPDDLTRVLGFPVPVYSDRWKNVKLPFETYGRWSNENYFINMICCGKSDLRLRVYDKALEVYEKKHKSYSQYYGLEKEYDSVFRIEYQMRGRALKEFVGNLFVLGVDTFDIDVLCSSVISCLFYKFDFCYLDSEFINPIHISTSCSRKPTLDGQIQYHKSKSGFHYFRYRDLVDEKEEIEKENGQIRKLVKERIDDSYKDLQTIFDFDFEKYSRSEYQDVVKDLPF